MFDTVLQILPLVALIAFGFGLKQAKFLTPEDGGSMLKLVFYAGSPALIFNAITKATIDSSLITLCFLPATIVCITMAVVFLLRRTTLKKLPYKTYGSLLSGAVILNSLFLIPFIQQLYGTAGLAIMAVFDIMNAMLIFSIIYAVLVKIGHDTPDYKFILKKLLIAPPLWALATGIVFKLNDITVPTTVDHTIVMVAALVSPVVLIAMGLKFTFRIKDPALLAVPLLLRFILGGIIGLAFVKLTGLHGLTAQVAVFASVAPIGFYSIIFSELEHLDVKFAVSQVSVGIIIAILSTPFLVNLLQYI